MAKTSTVVPRARPATGGANGRTGTRREMGESQGGARDRPTRRPVLSARFRGLLRGVRSPKVVDGLWGGGENSCREPSSQVRRLYGARPLPSTGR